MEFTPNAPQAIAKIASSDEYHAFYLVLDAQQTEFVPLDGIPLLVDDRPGIERVSSPEKIKTLINGVLDLACEVFMGQIFLEIGDPILDSADDAVVKAAYPLLTSAELLLVSEFEKQLASQLR